mmetsp:Transcript_53847/g.86150  ORF Transcript_53847/g.86150 Transcript_53847/m.86150 type:complete len:362 (-) Transcript_53847:266-1351(-)
MRTTGMHEGNNRIPPFYAVPLPTNPNAPSTIGIQPAQSLTMNHNDKQKHVELQDTTEPSTPESTDKRQDLAHAHADCDGIGDDELFEGSTHHFAIYFAEKRNVSGLIIAYFVFILQMSLYSICAHQVMGDLSGDQFMIPVQVRYGKDCKELKTNKDGSMQAMNLTCPPDLPNLSYVAFAAVLLAFFLMHDIVAGIRVMTSIPGVWAKFAGFIIVFEALFAALIGALFAVGAEDGYDAIANCIGVLFIHDADEKAFEAFQVINAEQLRRGKCCQNRCCGGKIMSKCCSYTKLAALFLSAFVIMVLSLMVAAAIRAAQKEQISNVYGEDSPYLSSGWFGDYYWDWDSYAYYGWDNSSSGNFTR